VLVSAVEESKAKVSANPDNILKRFMYGPSSSSGYVQVTAAFLTAQIYLERLSVAEFATFVNVSMSAALMPTV
jgi:hypothetical protein